MQNKRWHKARCCGKAPEALGSGEHPTGPSNRRAAAAPPRAEHVGHAGALPVLIASAHSTDLPGADAAHQQRALGCKAAGAAYGGTARGAPPPAGAALGSGDQELQRGAGQLPASARRCRLASRAVPCHQMVLHTLAR